MEILSEKCFYFIFGEGERRKITEDNKGESSCLACDWKHDKGKCPDYLPVEIVGGRKGIIFCYSFDEVLESYKD